MMSSYPFALVQIAAVVLMLALARQAYSKRSLPGAMWLSVDCLGVAIWALCDALALLSQTYSAKVLWNQVSYVGITTVPIAWCAFAFDYTGQRHPMLRRGRPLLFLPAIITIALAATNSRHGLIWSNITARTSLGGLLLNFEHGVAFWISSTWSYFLLLMGSLMLIKSTLGSFKLRRAQALWMLAGLVAPWAANIAYLAGLLPNLGTDLTSLAFSFSCVAVSVAVQRYGLFDIIPIARAAVIEGMRDGLFVLDMAGRVLDANPAAQRYAGATGDEILGRPFYQLFPSYIHELGNHLADPESADLVIRLEQGERTLELVLSTLPTDKSHAPARLAILRDVTDREQLISRLETALSEVQALEGLLPICAHCKRIRNDEGYWTQLEEYLAAHSKAQFTHGLCPACMDELYSDWLADEGATPTPPTE